MRISVILYLFFVSFPLIFSFNRITLISPHATTKKLYFDPSDNSYLTPVNLAFNAIPIVTLAGILYFQDSGIKDRQATQEKNLKETLDAKLKCFDDRQGSEIKNLTEKLFNINEFFKCFKKRFDSS